LFLILSNHINAYIISKTKKLL